MILCVLAVLNVILTQSIHMEDISDFLKHLSQSPLSMNHIAVPEKMLTSGA
jgi:hypothetical protein